MDARESKLTTTAARDGMTPELVAKLQQAEAYDHPVKYCKLLQTHISWILLTGDFAYKIKKPVNFGFVDFSTLDKRQFYCSEELRLNRRFAPSIYLETVAIHANPSGPGFFGDGPVIDYAVKMREFSQQDLFSAYAAELRLSADHVDAIAASVAQIHANAPAAAEADNFGEAEQVRYWSSENLEQIISAIPPRHLPADFDQFKQRCLQLGAEMGAAFESRKQQGFVRECHGDLHLANMALVDGRVTLFDCIEFNPALRWIDTISEAAFVAMDLQAHDYPGYCWRFINQYLEHGGDYAAVELLRYYVIYRALVRAKVEALRLAQQPGNGFAEALRYIELAQQWLSNDRPGLIIMHGLSGSGKSTVAAQLIEKLGAIRIRSDVERKRLFDYKPLQASDSGLDQGIYSSDATEATYARLGELAAGIMRAGFCVIVDATFLRQGQRQPFLQMAQQCSRRAIIIDCEAPEAVLRQRIIDRARGRNDASEANLAVLKRQLKTRQPIFAQERKQAQLITCAASGIDSDQIEKVREWLLCSAP